MASTSTVAVITRTKDRPVFLKRAIESVAGQTFTSYVHVIVNDGGDKKAVEAALAELSDAVKSNIKLFHRDEASNAPDTIFNESIDRVDSKYFAIHDDDDSWHEDFLQYTVERLESEPSAGAAVVRCDKVVEQQNGDSIQKIKTVPWMPDVRAINLYRQCVDNQFTPIATLFRRSAYQAVGKFDDTLPVIGDWEFGLRLLTKYDAEYIDPGFVLAFYHHRSLSDNSFAAHSHRYHANKVMNKYLREELAEGRLGVGYIMSKERYQQSYISRLTHKVMPKFVAARLKKRAEN
jgi:glycosyltransferase involved in cell wall biosynthesis